MVTTLRLPFQILLWKYSDPSNINAPWNQVNEYNEKPGDICCIRATNKYCYEHDKDNY